jgi:hypothetical protein
MPKVPKIEARRRRIKRKKQGMLLYLRNNTSLWHAENTRVV